MVPNHLPQACLSPAPWVCSQVSFLDAPTSWDEVDALFVVNRVVDLIFIFDLGLQFFLMYPAGDNIGGVHWVDSRRQIVRHYLMGWFGLDFFAIMLVTIDFITIESGGGDASDVKDLRVLRVLRALRLVKLVRLVRASRMFKRWESMIAINYAGLALARCMLGVLVSSHWFACVWALQTIFFDGPVGMVPVMGTDPVIYVDTWKGQLGYCYATAERGEDGSVPSECYDPWTLYCTSLYWAVTTITSIGYGDIHPTAQNAYEQMITAVLMLGGGFIWGQVIGTFCGIITSFDPHGAEFRRNMDDLNSFMSNKQLPTEMRQRLREYFHQTKHLQQAIAQTHLYRLMSPSLQGEVAYAANKKWLERIPFLSECSPEFKVELSMALSAKVFAAGETCPVGNLYVINRGIALYGARVLTAGKVWGDDVILMNPDLRSPFKARAMNYLETFTIDRHSLFKIADTFPRSRKVMRRCALIMALRRRMAMYAAAKQAKLTALLGVEWESPADAGTPGLRVADRITHALEEAEMHSEKKSEAAHERNKGRFAVGDGTALGAELHELAESMEQIQEEQRESAARVESTLAVLMDAVHKIQKQQQQLMERMQLEESVPQGELATSSAETGFPNAASDEEEPVSPQQVQRQWLVQSGDGEPEGPYRVAV